MPCIDRINLAEYLRQVNDFITSWWSIETLDWRTWKVQSYTLIRHGLIHKLLPLPYSFSSYDITISSTFQCITGETNEGYQRIFLMESGTRTWYNEIFSWHDDSELIRLGDCCPASRSDAGFVQQILDSTSSTLWHIETQLSSRTGTWEDDFDVLSERWMERGIAHRIVSTVVFEGRD